MTGDKIKLRKKSAIVENIQKIIKDGKSAEFVIEKGFDVWNDYSASRKNYFLGDYWEEH